MEKFGIFNMLEQFGSLFKSPSAPKKEGENSTGLPVKGGRAPNASEPESKQGANGGETYFTSPLNANSLEKFILTHEETSRRIQRKYNPPAKK